MADLDVDLGTVGTDISFSDDVSWETNGDGRELVSATVTRNDAEYEGGNISINASTLSGQFTILSFPKIQYKYTDFDTGEIITSSKWLPDDPKAKDMFEFKMNEPHDKDVFFEINYLVYDLEGGDTEEDAVSYSILYKKNIHNFIGETWAIALQKYFGNI
jgi:hypothetical protein